MRKLFAVLASALLLVGITASSASAHPTPEPKCQGETYAVVSASGDAAMAELIASWQVLDTKCVVEPGDAKAAIDSQQVVVLGGTKAVSESAVSGLNVIVRLAGADRVATANAVVSWINQRLAAEAETVVSSAGLTVAPEAEAAGFSRPPHKSDICDTAKLGAWTEKPFTAGGGCHVDHVVALKEAWRSGAHSWTESRWNTFSADPANHVASLACVNSSKSDRDAATWSMTVASGKCEGFTVTSAGCKLFHEITIAVKLKYSLTADAAEAAKLETADCSGQPDL